MAHSNPDYIIVGGGIAGCVTASRLYERDPSLNILLIEAGTDASKHPLVPGAMTAQLLLHSDLDWDYKTVQQSHLNNRECGWIRGEESDYNDWAEVVGDTKWNYDGFLPYIIIRSVTSSGREYPLREPLKAAFISAGIRQTEDANSGSPQGFSELIENRRDGIRQIASTVYPLDGVTVMLSTLVKRVIVEQGAGKKIATGVELADGTVITAKQEILLAAGSYRTPQVLLLSGIGATADLKGITQTVDLPEVGENFHDHMRVSQWWKLRHPEIGLAIGSPALNDPNCSPNALELDSGKKEDSNTLIKSARAHTESYLVYVARSEANPEIPMDGTHVTTSVVGLLPTSRGTVKLASTDPADAPRIDPNYYATEADRYVMRTGLKKMAQVLLETDAGRGIIEKEIVSEGLVLVTPDSADEDIDAHVRLHGSTVYHPAGTASMGKVVDSNLQVFGVERLRVVDASVLPVPIAAHIQACIYALAERAVDIILSTR